MEALGEKAARGLLRLPGAEGRAGSCGGPGEAVCWPPGPGRVSGSGLADEESERDSVHTGESHEGAEELHVELAQLSTEQLVALVEENRLQVTGDLMGYNPRVLKEPADVISEPFKDPGAPGNYLRTGKELLWFPSSKKKRRGNKYRKPQDLSA